MEVDRIKHRLKEFREEVQWVPDVAGFATTYSAVCTCDKYASTPRMGKHLAERDLRYHKLAMMNKGER